MSSFLNKVFGYKKHDDKETTRPTREASDSTLLDGKYEAIAPVLSPTTSTFTDAQPSKDQDRDGGFSLLKSKAREVVQKFSQKHPEDHPHLTLRLPAPKDSRSLGIVFEADPDAQIMLDDAVIAAKRLNPLEALILIKACAQAITERGLETLGIMHPHWFSASPNVQRRLISLFIRSLTQNKTITLSPSPDSPTTTFENELSYTRSPHDVAAVLRWGLRHLSLENGHFGKDSSEWGWYSTFIQVERNASYPPKGFSELLLPQLPAPHTELLSATLGLISSLASRAEANSISGSKLSKFLGLWLLVATRAEQSDDWKCFYARWERAGRILEHLFLARLREDSFAQRLPTRLQELIKLYPYSRASSDVEGDLFPRPRFSTRQYDALFVRVETVLVPGTRQPKQHPIQLLFEAFQLPIDDPSGNEHIALWNTLKTTAFAEASSSDVEGPQFTRIFVDESIHLLSLIPSDNSLPTSPTILTSPISQVVSRKRSSSPTKGFGPRSSANDVSTPASPTSPSSIVVTDWAQFTLSGFGDTPATQPLAALLSQDDDIEVTQPRKSSVKRGKSRPRRRRSEDQEPLVTPLSSRIDPESIVETKVASVHVVQIDEAFIDFWSDAIFDPISTNWPTFVICGLKQVPSAGQSIRWLVIEQAYSHQQSSRVPSPDGRRGRSPRPSFKSDISGFRINSVFSSARKRFSVFSKSATDLDLKKTGAKTPGAGELGEALVEEEATPSVPAEAGLHVDRNAAAKVTVASGATADVADQSKTGEISTAPIAGIPPVSAVKGEFQPDETAGKAPSIEATPRSSGGYNGCSVLPRPSEETISVERDLLRTLDVVNPSVDGSPNLVTAPLAADTPASHSTQDTYDPTFLASGPAPSGETPVGQGVVEAEVRPVKLVAQPVDRDERLHATMDEPSKVVVDVADSGSREDAGVVAMLPSPETITLAAATSVVQPAVVSAVDHEAPEPTVEAPRVASQSSHKASADPAGAFTAESVGGHEIDFSPVFASEITATEAGAQLAPHSLTSVGEVEGFAEPSEIPTPAPELVVLVEDTPGQEVSVDVCGRAGAAQVPAAKPDIVDNATSQLGVVDDAASQPVAAELQDTLGAEVPSVTHRLEAPSIEVALAVDTSVQIVTTESEHTTKPAAEDVQPHVQNTVIQAAEAPLVEALLTPKLEADVSAGIMSVLQAEHVASAEAGAQAQAAAETVDRIYETREAQTPTPVREPAALVDETFGPGTVTDVHNPVEAAPAITPEFVVEGESQVPVVEVVEDRLLPTPHMLLAVEAQSSRAELPTQLHDVQAAAGAILTGSHPEAPTAALATLNEDIAVNVAVQSTPDVSAPTEDVEVHTPPEIALAEESLGVTGPAPAIDEPSPQDVQTPVEIEQPLNESAPQLTDEATNQPPIVTVSAEEIQVEEQQEGEATSDTVDESISEDAELASVVSVLGQETRVVADVNEDETSVAGPELVEAGAPAPIVEDAPTSVEAEDPLSVVVRVSEEAVASRPDVAPIVDEIIKVDESQEVVVPMTYIDVNVHESAGLS